MNLNPWSWVLHGNPGIHQCPGGGSTLVGVMFLSPEQPSSSKSGDLSAHEGKVSSMISPAIPTSVTVPTAQPAPRTNTVTEPTSAMPTRKVLPLAMHPCVSETDRVRSSTQKEVRQCQEVSDRLPVEESVRIAAARSAVKRIDATAVVRAHTTPASWNQAPATVEKVQHTSQPPLNNAVPSARVPKKVDSVQETSPPETRKWNKIISVPVSYETGQKLRTLLKGKHTVPPVNLSSITAPVQDKLTTKAAKKLHAEPIALQPRSSGEPVTLPSPTKEEAPKLLPVSRCLHTGAYCVVDYHAMRKGKANVAAAEGIDPEQLTLASALRDIHPAKVTFTDAQLAELSGRTDSSNDDECVMKLSDFDPYQGPSVVSLDVLSA